jgi:EAL domain-containing protein (putative c-di-GMP-specific phosphodiesterase class I)
MRARQTNRGRAAAGPAPPMVDELERLRLQRILSDWVTGLPLYPVADLRNERIANLGVVYLQLGRFAGIESVYGWELYDQVLKCVTESLRADLDTSSLRSGFLSLQFTGSDGFYLLFDVGSAAAERQARLDKEAARFREGATRRLSQRLGRTIVELMAVHASAVCVPDDPRVRPSRNVIRGLREAARLVETRETAERLKLTASCRAVMAGRKLHAVYQPVISIKDKGVVGYEALIRGPAGELELPDVLFAVAGEADMTLELESLCLETIFAKVPRAVSGKKLFVNASPRLLGHSVFLDERNLDAMRRAHPDVVVEISEKEVVHDYPAFRETLDRLRRAGLQIAIDDAGSGYSGLESILQLRPEYIKVATSIVRNLHADTIKRQVITALATLGDQIQAPLIAEGIEQPEELDSLLALGVRMGQGYLLGRPQARIPRSGH